MIKVKKRLTYLLYILLLSPSLFAQEKDLSKGWLFKTGDDLKWSEKTFNDSDWQPIKTGLDWESQGYSGYDGFAWYRSKFTLPSGMKTNSHLKDSIKFLLGKIDDCDQVYLNGKLIGQNAGLPGPFEGNKEAYGFERRYSVSVNDAAVLWDKENTLAIRVSDHLGNGGMYDGHYSVSMVDVVDFLKFDQYAAPFRFPDDKNFVKKIVIKNVSEKLSFSGKLLVKILGAPANKIISQKEVVATISPKSSFEYEIKLPVAEESQIEYIFVESISKNSISLTQDIPYILTPKESPKPRINGARIFGVRPNHDIIYNIAATGTAPLTFTAVGLPKGASLDPKTGIISGKVATKGEFKVTIVASNSLGKDKKELAIVVGDQIALTPPMGWNSWNCWGLSVSDEKVREAADAMKSSGLINHGWSYVNIDDGWEDKRNDKGEILTNSKFPDMKKLSDYVHSKGLKIGIYSSPGPLTCGKFEGSYKHEEQDAKTYEGWGIDYLKYDWCSYYDLVPNPDLEGLKKPYVIMGNALANLNRDVVHSLCQYGWGDVWKWGNEVKGQLWRTTGDIEDTWKSMSTIGFKQDIASPYAKPGNWNDPDMLVVGRVGWGPKLHESRLTPDEQYTHISLWAMLAAPLLTGCDLTKLDEFTLSLLTNDEVIDIDQDPLGKQAVKVVKKENYEIWAKKLADGSKAVAIFNLGDEKAKIKVDWSELKINGSKTVRDVWRQKEVGKFDKQLEASVNRHGVYLVKISK
ncbi:MAG TPA: putative Ig domain-containing protein [Cytophagaceae bacterium]|jgi:hypothetical protein